MKYGKITLINDAICQKHDIIWERKNVKSICLNILKNHYNYVEGLKNAKNSAKQWNSPVFPLQNIYRKPGLQEMINYSSQPIYIDRTEHCMG